MQSIELLRYIKQWLWLIIICMVFGVIFVYKYASGHQSYTASVVIHYNNPEAALYGKSPDGEEIDFSEIYSASVISDVIEKLGLTESVEGIRRNCKVSEVIPEDIKKLKASALEEGKEYEYFPTTCIVTYTSENSGGTSYVMRVLDEILDSYFSHYAQNHINKVAVPDNSVNVSMITFDYLECAEIIKESVEELKQYCSDKNAQAPKFRSAATGYSFQDFLEIYEYYSDNLIPELYASVLNNSMTKSREILIERYQNNIAMSSLKLSNVRDQIQKEKTLIDSYTDKDKEGIEYHFDTTESNDYILNNVYYDDDGVRREYTVYDQLIFKYAELCKHEEILKVQIEHDRDIVRYFKGKTFVENDETRKTAEMIEQLPGVLGELYQLLCESVDEYNAYTARQSMSNLTNISTQEAVNVELYLLIAVVLFGVIGVFGAVFLGRLGDLLEYFIYIDKNVGIYNRARCDLMIDELSKKLVKEQFGCIVLRVSNQSDLNSSFGREQGDIVLRTLAASLKQTLEHYDGFAGYNAGAMFFCFLQDISSAMMAEIVDEVNHVYHRAMEFSENLKVAEAAQIGVGIVNSTDDDCYQIRKLLQIAISRSRDAVEESFSASRT